MTTKKELNKQIAQQLNTVVMAAREHFADSVEEYLQANKKAKLSPSDKASIAGMFTESVRSLLIAEVPAFVSWSLYNELNDPNIIKKIVPDLLNEYEGTMERIPERLVQKTKGLSDIGKNMVESMASTKEKKSEIVESLYKDLAQMSKEMKHLRASFDAVILSLSGE